MTPLHFFFFFAGGGLFDQRRNTEYEHMRLFLSQQRPSIRPDGCTNSFIYFLLFQGVASKTRNKKFPCTTDRS